ncbi:MAG: tetratricopeptide repeat protein [Candidatus Aminicenantia bacterium]
MGSNWREVVISIFFIFLIAGCSSKTLIEIRKEKDPNYQYSLGAFYLNEGKLDIAVNYFNKAISLEPRHYLSIHGLAIVCIMRGEIDKASKYLEDVLKIQPSFTEAHNYLGIIYQVKGELERAKQEFEKVVSDPKYPTPENAYFNLSGIEIAKGNLKSALTYIEMAIEKRKNLAIAHNRKGLILKELGDIEGAEDSFRKAVGLTQDDPEFNFNLAEILIRRGKKNEAKEILLKILPKTADRETKGKIENLLKSII